MSQAAITVSQPELLIAAPDDTTAVFGFGACTYTRATGVEMILPYQYERLSDVADEVFYRYSTDNGQTWSPPVQIYQRTTSANTALPAVAGMRVPSGPWLRGSRNPFKDETLIFDGYTDLQYTLSYDDGRTAGPYRPLLMPGAEFSVQHPFLGLYLGRNAFCNGLQGTLFLDADTFLEVADLTVLGPDGKLIAPTGWGYFQVAVLRAVRQGDGFVLDCAPLVTLDPDTQSTRGSVEPSLARLADGRPLLVFRGSNQDKFDLPSYTWYSLSSDEGRSWSPPAPWTYDDGTPFFSPSAHSQLVPHSSGRLFWIGNICGGSVARGNDPRYPLVVGEVDVHTGLLIRSSVTTIADRQPDQPAGIQFSNFGTYEDRVTHELVLDVPHFYPNRAGTGDTGDLFRYRLRVE